ncbi:MAG: FtsX-like permease family protein [Candidatus Aminicenantaceae bacterium]
MIIPRLAIRNLLGAGLKTWLNVIVLSFSFVIIIWMQGLYDGMGGQARVATIDAEYGGGQYWQENYDPFDPLSIQDAHAIIPESLQTQIDKGLATGILISQATIYPEGRLHTIQMKGIDPAQAIVNLPTQFLDQEGEDLPALIGTRMAKNTGLEIGDTVTVRWRDVKGTFDARDAKIVQIMKTMVPTVDQAQIWVPLDKLQSLTRMENEASLVILAQDTEEFPQASGWKHKDMDFLLKDINYLVKTKKVGGSIIYFILLSLAMLAIFNTQVLSIFRRRKEMGMLMSMGMTRGKLIRLFTLEGAMHSVLAAVVAAIYGIPLLLWSAKKGMAMPESVDDYGIALGEVLLPIYGTGLIIGTTILVLVVTTFVSFLPTRKIAKLKPTDALRGKMT